MTTNQAFIQPSMDSAALSRASLWLSEAMDLVHRVDTRLRMKSNQAPHSAVPVLRLGRRVLNDNACLSLAGFIDLMDR